MAEYIEREAAIDACYDGYADCRDDCADNIRRLPAADVRPVVHGRWHYTDAFPHWVCCSVCFKKFIPNREWIEFYDIPTNFCPNCGAQMDAPSRPEPSEEERAQIARRCGRESVD